MRWCSSPASGGDTERPRAVYLAVPKDIEAMGVPEGLAPLNVNVPRPDEPSASLPERAAGRLVEQDGTVAVA
jgi:hypothetical protein